MDFAVTAETTTSSSHSSYRTVNYHHQQQEQRPEWGIDSTHHSFDGLQMNSHFGMDQRWRMQRAPKKRVSFAEDAYLYSGNVTYEEVKTSWCTKDDFKSFKEERKEAIRHTRRPDFTVESVEKRGYCLRGLEPFFSLEINRAIKQSREGTIRTVLEEQNRQRSLNICDLEALRAQSCQSTQWVRESAVKLGLADAFEAERIQMQEALTASLGDVNSRARVEFIRSSALGREKSGMKLREDEERRRDDSRSDIVVRKLETALRLVGNMELTEY
jgi:hypothetical protein